jgi:hypothetical protein
MLARLKDSGNKWGDFRCNLGANEKLVCAYAHPRCRRSPSKFWVLRSDVALTSLAGFRVGDVTLNRVEIGARNNGTMLPAR